MPTRPPPPPPPPPPGQNKQPSRTKLEELYELWFSHLWDNIWSVREDSAVALGMVMRAYGDEAVARVVAKLDTELLKAKDQPADSKKCVRVAGLAEG